MRCRTLLAATGTALTAGVAGCSGIFGGNKETKPTSPAAAAEAYVRAAITGKQERAQELAHPDSLGGLSTSDGAGELTSIETTTVEEEFSSSDLSEDDEARITVEGQYVGTATLVRVESEAEIDGQTVESAFLIVTQKQGSGWLILDRGVPPGER